MAALDDAWRAVGRPAFNLAILEGPYLDQADPPALEHFWHTIDKLEQAGYGPRRACLVEDALVQRAELTRLTDTEAARAQAELYPKYRDLYSAKFLEALDQGRAVSDEDLEGMRALASERQAAMDKLMEDEGIDAWLTPAATGTAPKGFATTGDWAMNALWTYTGLPAITLPSGTGESNLPYGLQIVARLGCDEELLRFAEEIEQVLAC